MFYTPPPLSKKTKIIIIILVLLIHLFLLFPFLNTEFIFLPKSPLEQKVKELHKKVHKIKDKEPEEWATLKSRAMQMSAPVILVDDHDTSKDEEEKNNEKTDKQTQEDSELNEKDTTEKQTPHNKTNEDSTDKDILQPTLIDIPDKTGTHPITQKQEEKPAELKSLQDKKSTPQKKTIKSPIAPRKQSPVAATAKTNKPKLSLAQLAQGFVDHMQHEGDYTIAMSGHNSAKATESQLKVGRFLQRIIGSIQNAWRVNVNRYPLTHAVIVSMHFTIVINKDGSLNKVAFDKSSGDQRIDNYIRLIVQDASKAFPSIPDYMGHDICSIRCMLDDIKLPDGPPGYTIRQ